MATHRNNLGMPNDPKRLEPTSRGVAFAVSARTSYKHETTYRFGFGCNASEIVGIQAMRGERHKKEPRLATRALTK